MSSRPVSALACAVAVASLATTTAAPGVAQVKRVEMDIAGYLCGF